MIDLATQQMHAAGNNKEGGWQFTQLTREQVNSE
jgi:hypothetical protein